MRLINYLLNSNIRNIFFHLKKFITINRSAIRADEFASAKLPLVLQVEVTERCNFNCIMCCRDARENVQHQLKNDLTYDMFSKLITEIKPLYVIFTGLGEPLLSKELPNFIRLCKKHDILTKVFTNMSLMQGDMLEAFLENPPDCLIFSLHGATPESFGSITLTPDFNKCIANFENFLKRIGRKKPEIRILYALQAKNLNDYNQMFDYLKKWNMLDKFDLLLVYDFEIDDEKRRVIPTSDEKKKNLNELSKSINNCTQEDKKRFLKEWREVLINIRKRKTIFNEGPCTIPWIYAYVTAKGKVLPCCYLTNENYVMGCVYKKPFAEIWNGPEYKDFRKILRDNRRGLKECNTCYRNDLQRLKKYRFSFMWLGRSKWHKL